MAAIEDEYVMAIGGHYLKKFTNCGRCAEVTCVGNACPMEHGKPKSVTARIVAQTTQSDDDKDVELNINAWTYMMRDRAALPSMTVSWKYVSCPPPKDGRRKIYIHEDSNDRTYIVQPVNFEDPVKWMKFKNSAPKSKFSKPKTPLKGKVGFFGFNGKVKGKEPMKPPIFVDILMDDKDSTRIKTKMTSWEPGKMSFPDGLPPNEDADGPTQTKNDNMNFHVLGDIFGGGAPAKKPTTTTTTRTTTTKATTTRTTKPPRTKKPRPSRKPKPPKTKKPKKQPQRDAGFESNFEAPSFFGGGGPAPLQESSSGHNALNSFVFDILSPFEIPAAAPVTTPRTTTTTTLPTYTDIGVGFKAITGNGAPNSAYGGSCKVQQPRDTSLYASINKELKANACGWCVFIYCPSFSGCSGTPLKIQIVNEHKGAGDFALSKEAFKLITGKSLSAKDRAGQYKSTVQIMGC